MAVKKDCYSIRNVYICLGKTAILSAIIFVCEKCRGKYIYNSLLYYRKYCMFILNFFFFAFECRNIVNVNLL